MLNLPTSRARRALKIHARSRGTKHLVAKLARGLAMLSESRPNPHEGGEFLVLEGGYSLTPPSPTYSVEKVPRHLRSFSVAALRTVQKATVMLQGDVAVRFPCGMRPLSRHGAASGPTSGNNPRFTK